MVGYAKVSQSISALTARLLTQLAASLSQLPANGIIQIRQPHDKRTQSTLNRIQSADQHLRPGGSPMATAQTLIISVPRGATVLVILMEQPNRIENFGFAMLTLSRQRILYDFYAATGSRSTMID